MVCNFGNDAETRIIEQRGTREAQETDVQKGFEYGHRVEGPGGC